MGRIGQRKWIGIVMGLLVAGAALIGLRAGVGAAPPAAVVAPVIADPFHHLSGVLLYPPARMRVAPAAGGSARSLPARWAAPLTLPVFGPNVSAALGNSSAQNETTDAINPEDATRVIASANDYRCGLCPEVYLSTNSGATWTNYPVPGVVGLNYGDPAMTFGTGGYAYFGYLGYGGALCSGTGGMYVSHSTDAGTSFSAPHQLAANSNTGTIAVLQDKEYVAVDNMPGSLYNGNVYEGWTHFAFQAGTNCGDPSTQLDASTIFSRSTDHGVSWSVPITASPVISNNNQGTVPAVGRHGEVYLYYLGAQTQSQVNYDTVLFSRSTDGGQTFPFFTHIASIVDLPSPLPHTSFRNNAFGAMAVDPQVDGYLYAVWADYRAGDADILFSRSTDNGTTWGPPQRVNDDPVGNGKDQFFPWITTSPDGRIHIGWFDRREDPNDANYKEYYTDSLDHGVSFEANVAVSTAPSVPAGSGFIGDYSGIAATTGEVIPVWTDIRAGANQDAYVAQGVYTTTQGTPSPTATATPAGCQTLPAWQAGPPRNPARQYIQGAVGTGGKFYTVGGWLPSGSNPPVSNDASRLDPTTNTWEALPPLPVPEGVYGLAAGPGKIYVVGGSDIPTRTLTTTVQVFDIASNSWSFGPPVPRATGVQGPAVAVVNNHLYVIGGADNNNVYATNNILDLTTNTWTTGAPLPLGLFLTGATTANGLVYVFGGSDDAGNSTDTLYAYNPATDTWATLAAANTGGLGVVPSISPYGTGRLIATLGTDYATFARRTTATRIYDIASNTWSAGPPVNNARYGNAQDTLLDGRVIIYGGSASAAGRHGGSAAAPAAPDVATNSTELLAPPPPLLCTPTATATSAATVTPIPPTVTSTAHPATSTPVPASATPTATATPGCIFIDVCPGDYFYDGVRYLLSRYVISGYGDGTFRPYNPTTRSQMVKIVIAGFNKPITTPTAGGYTFADVQPGFPFFPYIETAVADHIISGYACGGPGEPCDPRGRPYFRPYAYVTRGQLSKIDVVAAGWPLQSPATGTFADVAPGSAFYPFIETAACHGVISGYTCGGPGEPCDPNQRPYFRQYNNAARGQIAKIVYLSITGSGTCAGEAAR